MFNRHSVTLLPVPRIFFFLLFPQLLTIHETEREATVGSTHAADVCAAECDDP